MGSFAQFLDNAGIHIAPGLFIAIIVGGVIFVVVLVVAIVLVHRRSKRKIMQGAFDKTSFSVAALTLPRPPLPTYPTASPSLPPDREAQKQHDLVGRERPGFRTGTPTLPDQAPRRPPFHAPRMMQWDPAPRSPLTAYPIVTCGATKAGPIRPFNRLGIGILRRICPARSSRAHVPALHDGPSSHSRVPKYAEMALISRGDVCVAKAPARFADQGRASARDICQSAVEDGR
ncbi:hypothetical protein C8F04DRAFT_446086 [Mycena alexandri]|uniref:Uncharacterized protein n=1 Tax=Mycena alexandri TaxID=1745969 RepID=A0AAD6TKW0_9AGAR|nr:hypothetical protein C8F04DRAFT_446086 [Mycena alexandri]